MVITRRVVLHNIACAKSLRGENQCSILVTVNIIVGIDPDIIGRSDVVAAFIDGADYLLIGATELCGRKGGGRKGCGGTSGVVVADGDRGGLVAKEVETLLLSKNSCTIVVIVEEHGPEVAPLGCTIRARSDLFGGYPGADFIQVEFLVIVVDQSDGEAVGGAVDGVVGVHVACGALPLVGDGEGDGVVGDEEGANIGRVGDCCGVGDESELHLGRVPTEIGAIDVEREGVGYLSQPRGGDGGAAALGSAGGEEGMEVGALDDGLVVDAALAEVPSVDVAVAGLAVGVPFFVE